MEEDDINLQVKRNTDCVYFLASPLTCKKGIECEYRHNEMARLNPRDCWYWMSSCCFNPTCAFRHPPLEMHAEAAPESSASSSVKPNQTNVPCYFYFSGFCSKGDKCSFMHGPDANTPTGGDANTPTGGSANSATVIKEDIPLDRKKSVAKDTVLATKQEHPNPSETAANGSVLATKPEHPNPSERPAKAVLNLKMKPKEDVHFATREKIVGRSPSTQISVPLNEVAVAPQPGFFLRADSFTESRSHINEDHSLEGEVEDCDEGEWWESSPGFDVLVDHESEYLVYEDDQEYLLSLEREQRDPNNHFLGYDLEDLDKYDTAYNDTEDDYEDGNYDSANFVDNFCFFDAVGNKSGLSRNPVPCSLLSRKRKIVAVELLDNDRRIDLRDRLEKRRRTDGRQVIWPSRRRDSSCLLGQNQGRSQRLGINRRLHGRLASEVRNTAVVPHQKNGSLLNGASQHGWQRNSCSIVSRRRHKEKRLVKSQILLSEISRKPDSRERRSVQESTGFTGPKTLAQIKEEKRKAEENGDCAGKTGNSSRMTVADFESPKPLSEILKDKRKLSSALD